MIDLPTISPGTHPEANHVPVVWVHTPYREVFVTELKAIGRWDVRGWEPEMQAWWVVEEKREEVIQLVLNHWPDVLIEGDGGESDYILNRHGETFPRSEY